MNSRNQQEAISLGFSGLQRTHCIAVKLPNEPRTTLNYYFVHFYDYVTCWQIYIKKINFFPLIFLVQSISVWLVFWALILSIFSRNKTQIHSALWVLLQNSLIFWLYVSVSGVTDWFISFIFFCSRLLWNWKETKHKKLLFEIWIERIGVIF